MKPPWHRQTLPHTALSICILVLWACSREQPSQPGDGENNPPVARLTVTPDSGSVFTTFTFDASESSDLEDGSGQLRLRWDWNGNRRWDTPLETEKQTTHRFTEEGQHRVFLEVRDTGDLADTTQVTITVIRTLVKWRCEGNFFVESCPAIGTDGTIYVSSWSYLHAVSPEGEELWRCTLFPGDSSPTIGPDGTIFVTGQDRSVFAVNPDGSLKWETKLNCRVSSFASPAIGSDGTLYIGADSLYAIDQEGTTLWSSDIAGGAISSPAISQSGTIYVASKEGIVHAFQEDGILLWQRDSGATIWSSPAVDYDGTVYIGFMNDAEGADGLVARYANGIVKWKYLTGIGAINLSSPVIGPDGTIYIGGIYGRMHAVNPDGTRKWLYDGWEGVQNEMCLGPAIADDGTIYFGCYGRLYALGTGGELLWRHPIGYWVMTGPSGSPTIAPDGTVYVGGKDGSFYAFNADSGGLADSPWPKFDCNLQNTGRKTP